MMDIPRLIENLIEVKKHCRKIIRNKKKHFGLYIDKDNHFVFTEDLDKIQIYVTQENVIFMESVVKLALTRLAFNNTVNLRKQFADLIQGVGVGQRAPADEGRGKQSQPC